MCVVFCPLRIKQKQSARRRVWNFLFWSGFVFDKICNFEGKKKMMEKWHSSLVDRADGEYA
ncbi:MAG: hypothetical protein K2L46_08330, partial [Paramuribaculum sp.]|nr:hypothetical protein [Paramuribaculum sp.]